MADTAPTLGELLAAAMKAQTDVLMAGMALVAAAEAGHEKEHENASAALVHWRGLLAAALQRLKKHA